MAKIFSNKKIEIPSSLIDARSGVITEEYLCTSISLDIENGKVTVNAIDYKVQSDGQGGYIPILLVKKPKARQYDLSAFAGNDIATIETLIADQFLIDQKANPIFKSTADDWISESDFIANVLPNI